MVSQGQSYCKGKPPQESGAKTSSSLLPETGIFCFLVKILFTSKLEISFTLNYPFLLFVFDMEVVPAFELKVFF